MKKFNYDSYYEIINPENFSTLLSESFRKQIRIPVGSFDYTSGWNEIKYMDKNDISNTDNSDVYREYFIKGTNFVDEREWRFTFALYEFGDVLLTATQKFIDIEVNDEMRKCCKFPDG